MRSTGMSSIQSRSIGTRSAGFTFIKPSLRLGACSFQRERRSCRSSKRNCSCSHREEPTTKWIASAKRSRMNRQVMIPPCRGLMDLIASANNWAQGFRAFTPFLPLCVVGA